VTSVSARFAKDLRVIAAKMATSRLVNIVTVVPMIAAKRVLTATVVTCAGLDTGDQRVTRRVVQGVMDFCVT